MVPASETFFKWRVVHELMGHISVSWSVKWRDLNSGGLLLYSLEEY